MRTIKLTDAQLTALQTAGVLDCPHGDDEIALFNAVKGNRLTVDDAEYMACIVCDLSNRADELGEIEFRHDERGKMYRHDARVLTNLMRKLQAA
jgi:hypothetical protein